MIRRADDTFQNGLRFQQSTSAFKITVLRTPENQGYGGNQKLGYRYAIDQRIRHRRAAARRRPVRAGKTARLACAAVAGRGGCGFRFAHDRQTRGASRRHAGLQMDRQPDPDRFPEPDAATRSFSEFHSGYRLYSTNALAQIPFEKNTNDFHFDTEIIIQFVLKKMRIAELPIPTFYGDEICHVNGLKYALGRLSDR